LLLLLVELLLLSGKGTLKLSLLADLLLGVCLQH